MATQVLLVDDDIKLRRLIARYLGEREGFVVDEVDSGVEALGRIERAAYDVIVLDVMMPGFDGLATLAELRRGCQTPVLFLTARGDEGERVHGLDAGADDYLAKPCSLPELAARIRVLVRRHAGSAPRRTVVLDGLLVDLDSRQASWRDRPFALTGAELDVLVALMRSVGRELPREALRLQAGRGDTPTTDRAIDIHILHLRRKLAALGDAAVPRIVTVRGVGFVLVSGSAGKAAR
jgi:two-component system response regulator CpxR